MPCYTCPRAGWPCDHESLHQSLRVSVDMSAEMFCMDVRVLTPLPVNPLRESGLSKVRS